MHHKPNILSTFCFILLQSLFANYAHAAEPVVHISPKPAWLTTVKPYNKKVPARDVGNGYFFQLAEEQINVANQADYTHVIKEIVSEAGIQNGSTITIGFDPSFERVDIHEVIVWRNGKAQSRLSAKLFKVLADEKELSRFIYQGSYSAYCILDDIRKGDRIEYSFTLTGRNPIFGGKYFRDLYLQSSQPIAQIYKSIQVPASRKLNFKSFNNPPKVSISNRNGLTCYEWEGYQVKPPPYADNQPGWYNNYSYVQVSEYNSWQEVTNWALNINPTATNLTGQLARQVAQLKAVAGTNKAKYFREAVKLVQDEVRYMGIEMGEYSHRANTPERVFSQRYGDCKDKSLLLVSILNAGGIEAHMVLVNATVRGGIDQYIPTPNAFDHAVVMAIVNNKPVWVDATIAYQRGTGTNIYFPNYGKGLVLKAGNTALTAVTPVTAGRNYLLEKYTIPADDKEKVKLVVTSTYTLNEADKMRDRLASASTSETEKNYLAYYTKIYPKIEAQDSLTIIDDPDDNRITTIEHYLIPGFFKKGKDEGHLSASFYGNTINDQLPSIANNAKTPVALSYPYNLNYDIKVVMQNGWNVEKHSTSIKRDAYDFRAESWSEGDTLTLNYKFSYLKNFLPLNKLDEARDDFKRIADEELSYTFTYAPDISKVPFRFNYWMFAALLIIAGGLAYLFYKIYHRDSIVYLYQPVHYIMPIGGWLVLPAITLGLTPLAVLVTLIKNEFFNLNSWGLTVGDLSKTGYNLFFLFEAVGNVFLICYAVFCFILLLKKHDIFPKHGIGFYAFLAMFSVVDTLLSESFIGNLSNGDTSSMMKSVIFAAVWIPYFIKSTRVAHTFIVPQPANNYEYDVDRQQTETPVLISEGE